LIKGKRHYKAEIRKIVFVSNSSTSQQTSAVEAHLTEEQLLLKERALNKANLLSYKAGTTRPNRLHKRTEFRTKINIKREQCIEMVPAQLIQSMSVTVMCMEEERKETIKTTGCKLLLDVFQFVGISRHNTMGSQ
jgi:hypothetical protein